MSSMTLTRARQSLVLQGYFRAERFRGAVRRAEAMQPAGRGDWAAKAPRPDLMPARTSGGAVQARRAAGPGTIWPGAPRPDLLPGMGAPRGVAQPRSNHGISTTPIPAGQLRVIGDGRPIEPGIRQAMERFFQADFSGVRVHEGPAARAMGALAFTLGEEIHFAPGLYAPESREGLALLGHELTHVVQQRDGRVANPYGQGVAIVQDPALEAEADRMGQKFVDEMWPAQRMEYRAHRALPRTVQMADEVKTKEKDCYAHVHYGLSQSVGGAVEGRYDPKTCEHAEISALSAYIDRFGAKDDKVAYYLARIQGIQISSPPCKVCDKILRAIGLRSMAQDYDGDAYPSGVYGRVTGSYGKPSSAALRKFIFGKIGALKALYGSETNSKYDEGSYWQLMKDQLV